jgi:hypothetical protein
MDIMKDKDSKVGDYIRSRDIVYFELQFTEIWLEVEMELFCEDKAMTLSFELKVENETYISELRHILIKLGIKSWKKYIDDLTVDRENKIEYYLLYKFSLDLDNDEKGLDYIELEKIHGKCEFSSFLEKVSERLNFESKIRCSLEFLNFNKIILTEATRFITNEKKMKVTPQRRKIIRALIQEYLTGVLKNEYSVVSKIGFYKKVIWKWNFEDNEVREIFT